MLTLRRKTMLWTSILLVVSLAVVYELSRRTFLEEMTLLGQEFAERRAVVAANIVRNSLAEVRRLSYDWAVWDATCEFVEGRRPGYAAENLTPLSLQGIHVDLIVISDASGRPIITRVLEGSGNEARPAPPKLLSLLRHLPPNGSTAADMAGTAGLFEYAGEIYLMATHPILPSDEQGEPRGTLVMARRFDQDEQRRLEEVVQSEFKLRHIEDPAVGAEISKMLAASRDPMPVASRVLDTQTRAGYALLHDVFGDPKFVVEVAWQRVFYAQGRRILYYFLLAFVAVGLVLIASVLLLLRRLVLNPFTRLSHQVAKLGERGDLFRRVDMDAGEEMNNLAKAINRMLDDLQRAQEALRRSDQQFRAIVDHQVELICRFGVDGRLSFVNRAFSEFFGRPEAELAGQGVMALTAAEDQALIQRELISLSPQRTVGTVESRIHLPSGETRWVHWTIRAFLNDTGTELSGFQAVGHDITERRSVEQALRRRVAMEEMISGISTDFLNLPNARLEEGIVSALRRVGQFTGADRCYIRLLSEDRSRIQLAFEWYGDGLQRLPYDVRALPASAFPWLSERLLRLEILRINRLDDLPPEAAREMELWRQVGAKSLLVAPLVLDNRMAGFIGLTADREPRAWTDEDGDLMKLVGDVFVGFLARKRAENALH